MVISLTNSTSSKYLSVVSVVVTAYNGDLTIEKCVKKIMESDYPADLMEVIIVDDGSKDSTYTIIQRLHNEHALGSRIKIIRQENKGHAEAINAGFGAAKGDIIFSVSQDVYVSREFIKRISQEFADKTVGIVQGPLVRVDNTVETPIYHCTTQLQPGAPYVSAAIAYRRDAVEKVGGLFDCRLSITGDDTDFALRILDSGYQYRWVDTAKAYHDIVPKKISSLLKSVRSKAPEALVLLVKIHPELRASLFLRFFWPGCLTPRVGSIAIFALVPLFFYLGATFTVFSLVLWYLGFCSYTWFISYRGITYNKKILLFLPLVAILNIVISQVSFLKHCFYSVKHRFPLF